MVHIVGIGANVFDTLYRLDSYPEEDTKKRVLAITECGGGPCGTGLVAAAKLGAKCAYIGNCSGDRAGAYLQADFQKYGVETKYMKPIAGVDSFRSCIWLSDEASTRTCVYYPGSVPPTQLDEEKAQAIMDAKVLLVDGNDLDAAVAGAKIARENNTLVLYDAGGRYQHVERLLALTDILIPSEEFALGHTGEDSVETAAKTLWQRYHPSAIVITQGKKGGIFYDGEQLQRYPAFSVEAVDTNGAGDVFHGAFAFALTKGYDYGRCCVFSSAVSALKCMHIGARSGAPTFAEVKEFLDKQGVVL